MSSRGDEVNATVDSGVWNPFLSVDVDLLLQVCLILVINELHDGLPARSDKLSECEGAVEKERDGHKMKGGSNMSRKGREGNMDKVLSDRTGNVRYKDKCGE